MFDFLKPRKPRSILITAGAVHSPLDDNKVVSNKARGLWAVRFAGHLLKRGHYVTLLINPWDNKSMDVEKIRHWCNREGLDYGCPRLTIRIHQGFEDYRIKCLHLASRVDAAVMAAAVTNWIPAKPVLGKMQTEGYTTNDIIQVPFCLAPNVIQEMKSENPRLCLIGCKMLVYSSYKNLIDTAYTKVLQPARCNMVLANDLTSLKKKYLVYPDMSVQAFENDFKGLYENLTALVEDLFWTTDCGLITGNDVSDVSNDALKKTMDLFNYLADKYRYLFFKENNHIFGGLAVRCTEDLWFCSPRKKNKDFSVDDAVAVKLWLGKNVVLTDRGKASLNAPLLIRVGQQYKQQAVLHFHDHLVGASSFPYAPPGSVRDNNRKIPRAEAGVIMGNVLSGFNIKGHGCVCSPFDNVVE